MTISSVNSSFHTTLHFYLETELPQAVAPREKEVVEVDDLEEEINISDDDPPRNRFLPHYLSPVAVCLETEFSQPATPKDHTRDTVLSFCRQHFSFTLLSCSHRQTPPHTLPLEPDAPSILARQGLGQLKCARCTPPLR